MSEKAKNRIQTFLKIIFFVSAFFLVIFTVLANMGGKSDALKQMVEQFIAESSGYDAKIETLNGVTFFPSLSCDFENLDLYKRSLPGIPAAHVDRLRISLGFWDVLASNGKIKLLDAHGIKAMPGVLLDKAIRIDAAAIADDGPNAAFEGKGSIGDAPLDFSMSMKVFGEGRKKKYRFGLERDFSLALGGVKIAAALKNAQDPYLTVENLIITLNEQNAMTGTLAVSRRTDLEIRVRGEIQLPENGTALKPDLVYNIEKHKISGALAAEKFNAADFQDGSRFDRLTEELVRMLGDPAADKDVLDKFFSRQEIRLEATPYSGPLAFKDNVLKIQ